MNKKITKPKYSIIENDEYFYRDSEMFRTDLRENIQEYLENTNIIKEK